MRNETKVYTLSCYSKWNDSFQQLKSTERWSNVIVSINSRETMYNIMILVGSIVGVMANLSWICNELKHKQLSIPMSGFLIQLFVFGRHPLNVVFKKRHGRRKLLFVCLLSLCCSGKFIHSATATVAFLHWCLNQVHLTPNIEWKPATHQWSLAVRDWDYLVTTENQQLSSDL